MVQRVNIDCPLRNVLAGGVDISEDLAGGTLVDRPHWLADAIFEISSSVGFPALLVDVAARIRWRNVKALIDCG